MLLLPRKLNHHHHYHNLSHVLVANNNERASDIKSCTETTLIDQYCLLIEQYNRIETDVIIGINTHKLRFTHALLQVCQTVTYLDERFEFFENSRARLSFLRTCSQSCDV